MRLILLVLVLVGACGACSSCQPAPTPALPTDQALYFEMVDAGCMAPDDGGPAYFTKERTLNPPPAWFNCLASGGTVAGCAVPCSKDGGQ